jgi:hypothetical protein
MKNKELYLSSSAAGIKLEAWSHHNQDKNRYQHSWRFLSEKRKLQQKIEKNVESRSERDEETKRTENPTRIEPSGWCEHGKNSDKRKSDLTWDLGGANEKISEPKKSEHARYGTRHAGDESWSPDGRWWPKLSIEENGSDLWQMKAHTKKRMNTRMKIRSFLHSKWTQFTYNYGGNCPFSLILLLEIKMSSWRTLYSREWK